MDSEGVVLLTGGLGRDVYREYSKLVDNRFERKGELFHHFSNNFKRYDLMLDDDGTVQGCGSFSMCLMDEVLQKHKLRIVDLYDYQSLARIIHPPSDVLRRMHLNLGLVLVANKWFDLAFEDRYHKGTKRLKENLKRQLLEKGFRLTEPVYIPFSSLELQLDADSPLGLQFKLIDTSSVNGSAQLVGDYSRYVLDNTVFHVEKANKQGLYDFKVYFNTVCTLPGDMDDLTKPHHNIGPQRFDKMSHSYGRILVVPLDYGNDSIKSSPNSFFG